MGTAYRVPAAVRGVEMTTTCTRCEGTGFLNMDQLPEDAAKDFDDNGEDVIHRWIIENSDHDVQVCDCCGDGVDCYGVPGEHYGPDDPPGDNGPYANNGGLCHCH